MKRISSIVLILSSFLALSAWGQQSTPADYREFSQLISGRWLGDVTLVGDWAGVGKKGERIVAHAENTLIEDGHVGLYRGFYGTGSETGVRLYDAGSKQIIDRGGDSGGGVWMSVFSKQGKKWVQKLSGSDAKGVRFESERTWEFSDGGRTVTISGAHLVGGKKVGDVRDVWRRVSS